MTRGDAKVGLIEKVIDAQTMNETEFHAKWGASVKSFSHFKNDFTINENGQVVIVFNDGDQKDDDELFGGLEYSIPPKSGTGNLLWEKKDEVNGSKNG